MKFLILTLLLGAGSYDGENDKSVDLIERNHVYTEDGEKYADQLIFYDWDEEEQVYKMEEWWLFQYVRFRQNQDGGYEAILYCNGKERSVRSRKFQETWTQYDQVAREKEALKSTSLNRQSEQ